MDPTPFRSILQALAALLASTAIGSSFAVSDPTAIPPQYFYVTNPEASAQADYVNSSLVAYRAALAASFADALPRIGRI